MYKFTFPDVEEPEFDVNVTDRRISIDGKCLQEMKKKDAQGQVIARSRESSSVHQSFSIPGDADAQRASIENAKQEIIVTLPKKHAS